MCNKCSIDLLNSARVYYERQKKLQPVYSKDISNDELPEFLKEEIKKRNNISYEKSKKQLKKML